MRFFSYFLFLLFINFSCTEEKKIENSVLVNRIQQKIKELENNSYKLHQFIAKDSKIDTLLIDSVEWKKELMLFLNYAIPVKKLGEYKTTKTIKKEGIQTEYLAKNKEVEIRKVSYSQRKDGSFIYYVFVVKKNRLSDITYKMEFDSRKGYLIKSHQNVPYSYQTNFRIEGIFIQ